jgi:hypothetical protein
MNEHWLKPHKSKKINKIFREQEEAAELARQQRQTQTKSKKQTAMPPVYPKSSS